MADDSDLMNDNELQVNACHSVSGSSAARQHLEEAQRSRLRPFPLSDESECLLFRLDHTNETVHLEQVPWPELGAQQHNKPDAPSLQPELRSFMLETTPSKPFGDTSTDLLECQSDLAKSRKLVNDVLGEDRVLVTLPYYPLYGVDELAPNELRPKPQLRNPITWSSLVSDDHISSSARYRTVLANIVQKRGSPVDIHVPLYEDEQTFDTANADDASAGSIFMDFTLFDATGCSLQVTMQARNLDEALQIARCAGSSCTCSTGTHGRNFGVQRQAGSHGYPMGLFRTGCG
jgi:hypothetical protein